MVLSSKFQADPLKTIKMALIHDLGEAEIGDLVTMHGSKILSSSKTKVQQEIQALNNIFSKKNSLEYIKLFKEFEQGKSPEARLVKQLDKLEMTIQAMEYEQDHGSDLSPFVENAKIFLTDQYFKDILKKLEILRNQKLK